MSAETTDAPVDQDRSARLRELLAVANRTKKPEVLVLLAELDVDPPEGANVGDLRALLVATQLDREQADPDVEAVVGEVVDESAPAVEPEVDEAALEDEVGQAIALREHALPAATTIPTPSEFNAIEAIAARIYNTSVVPTSYRGKHDDVFAALLFARELQMDFISALRDIYVIEGKTALAAHRQLAFLRRGGVQILESEATAERAYIRAQRKDTGEIMAVEFTFKEASKIKRKNAFLVDGDNWKNYPADMLWARAVGRLTRRLGSDLIAGGLPPYVADEVADFSGWGVTYGEGGVDVSAPPPARQQGAGRVETPKSWAEIGAWAEPYGPELGWGEWTRDAASILFENRDLAALTNDQKRALSLKAAGAIVALRDAIPPDRFPPPTREEVQKAWAAVLDGQILAGPDWRMSAEETTREPLPPPELPLDAETAGEVARDEREPAEEARQGFGPSAEELAEAEQIPFGEDDIGGYGG